MNQFTSSVPIYDFAILGAGVAGLSAARILSPSLKGVVIDSEEQAGGLAWQLGCKATDRCLYCGVCHGIQLRRDLRDFSSYPFDLILGQQLSSMFKENGNYHLSFKIGRSIIAHSILIATGIQPFDARQVPQYGYGTFPHIYTGIEIERNLNSEGVKAFNAYQKIAFIQCIGSRNFKEKRGYCSRVCCRYALRIAEDLAFQYPHLQIDMYYMDLQLLGGNKELLAEISEKRVRLIRHMPYRVESPNGKPILLFEDDQKVNRVEYDAVILSVGMTPNPGTKQVADILRVNIDDDGFIKDYGDGIASQENIYVCGAASGAKDIETAISDGKKVAQRILSVHQYLQQGIS